MDEEPLLIGRATSYAAARKIVAEYRRHNNLGREIRGRYGFVETPYHPVSNGGVYFVEWLTIDKITGDNDQIECVYCSNYFIS